MEQDQIAEYLKRIANAVELIAENLAGSQKSKGLEINIDSAPSESKTSNNPENISTTSEDSRWENDVNPILRYLSERNIEITSFQTEDEIDEVLDSLSLFMGNNYSSIKKGYEALKRSLNSNKGVRLKMDKFSQQEISQTCQFFHSLHKIAFLRTYKYFKSPKFLLRASPHKIPTATSFITGQWLERYIKASARAAIQKRFPNSRYSFLTNPKIVLPNKNAFELDVLFSIEDEILWFEAKTGDYQNYISRYSKMSKTLNLDHKQCIMVLSEVSEKDCLALSKVFSMTVANLDSLNTQLEESLDSIEGKIKIFETEEFQ